MDISTTPTRNTKSHVLYDGAVDYVRLREAIVSIVSYRASGRTFASCALAAAAMCAAPSGTILVYPVARHERKAYVAERILFWLQEFNTAQITYQSHDRITIEPAVTMRIIKPERNVNATFMGSRVALYCTTLSEFQNHADRETDINYADLMRRRPEMARAQIMESELYQALIRQLKTHV